MDIDITHISHIIISSIIASVLSRLFWGEFPAFQITSFQLTSYWELSIYLVLGISAGFVSIIFVRMIYATDEFFIRLPIAEWIKPAIGGLLLGIIALKLPQVLGVGYGTINILH